MRIKYYFTFTKNSRIIWIHVLPGRVFACPKVGQCNIKLQLMNSSNRNGTIALENDKGFRFLIWLLEKGDLLFKDIGFMLSISAWVLKLMSSFSPSSIILSIKIGEMFASAVKEGLTRERTHEWPFIWNCGYDDSRLFSAMNNHWKDAESIRKYVTLNTTHFPGTRIPLR